jgi:hypothetical protein
VRADERSADFYKGKSLTIIVGFSAGGGYDLNARAIGRSIGKHIAGAPKIIIQNMPGAGSLSALNHLANLSPKDGTELAMFSRGAPFEPLMDNKQAQFDPRVLTWIGSPSRETNLVFTRASAGLHSLADLRQHQTIIATSGGGADTATFPLLMNAIFNTQMKVITGYPGANEMLLAVERSEADGIAGLSWGYLKAVRPSWLVDKKIDIQLQLGLGKAADLPDVPSALDLVSTEADRQFLEVFLARLAIAWPLAGPQGIAKDRALMLRDAFAATMTDPDYIQDAEKQSIDINPVYADEILAILNRVYSAPPEVVARARQIADAAR